MSAALDISNDQTKKFSLVNKKILIVEDEPELAELLEYELDFFGYQTLTKNCGSDAVELLKNDNSIGLIISDIRMPNGDGVELLETVLSDYNKSIPVILMSGFSEITDKIAKEKGALTLLAKPVDYHKLIVLIETTFEVPSQD
jgi:DNA-binding NtrC family response regulator